MISIFAGHGLNGALRWITYFNSSTKSPWLRPPDTLATKAEIAYWQRQATDPAEGQPRPVSATSG
jgi:hypothetical protein